VGTAVSTARTRGVGSRWTPFNGVANPQGAGIDPAARRAALDGRRSCGRGAKRILALDFVTDDMLNARKVYVLAVIEQATVRRVLGSNGANRPSRVVQAARKRASWTWGAGGATSEVVLLPGTPASRRCSMPCQAAGTGSSAPPFSGTAK